MELITCHVVVSSARGIGEGIVRIVDLLELLGARLAIGAVGGHAVGVVAERLPVEYHQSINLQA